MTINSSVDAAIGLLGAVAGSIPAVQTAEAAENKAVSTFTAHNPELAGLITPLETTIESYVSRFGQGILSFVEELLPHVQTAASKTAAS